MKTGLPIALLLTLLLIVRSAAGADPLPWLSSLEQSSLDRPLVIFFSIQSANDEAAAYQQEVLQSSEMVSFLRSHSATVLWVAFATPPYLDPKATLSPDLRGKLEVARTCKLDVSRRGVANPKDYPSLFLATGPDKIFRLMLSLRRRGDGIKGVEAEIEGRLSRLRSLEVESPLASLPAPGMLLVYGPNVGYAWDGSTTNPPQIFAPAVPVVKAGNYQISGLAIGIGRNGLQYFARYTSLRGRFFRSDRGGTIEIFPASRPGKAWADVDVDPVVRDVRLDDEDNVFFSQTRKGAGKIFRLAAKDKPADPKPEIFYTSRLSDLQNWTGNFCFGRKPGGKMDTDQLYLIANRAIYRVGRKDGVWLAPQRIPFSNPLQADAIEVTSPDEAIALSGRQLVQIQSWTRWHVVATLPGTVSNVTLAH